MVPIADNFSVSVNQEFSEVPWNVSGNLGRFIKQFTLASQVSVDWVRGRAINLNFVEQRELCVVGAGKFFDFFICSRLLTAELVAGES